MFRDKPEFPWDIHLRGIYDWNGFFKPGHPTQEEINTNNFTFKANQQCTALFYGKYAFIAPVFCMRKGEEDIRIGNRFAVWLARGAYQYQFWLSTNISNQRNDTAFPPNAVFEYPPNSSTGAQEYQNQIGIIRLLREDNIKEWETKKSKYAAIELAPDGMDFNGKCCKRHFN